MPENALCFRCGRTRPEHDFNSPTACGLFEEPHPTQQPVKKFAERSRDLANESAESGAKTDPKPKGTCSKHVGLHINIEELCEEWHEEREFDAYCKAMGFWPTDENFKIWKESPLRGFANSGPLCDNCSKASREHYCYFGSSYDEKFSPSERRPGPFSELQITIDTATKPLHAEIEKLRGDTRELKAATKEFIIAVERLLDWMNGNDISADHETAQPDDFNKLCESLTKLKQMLG